MISQDIDIKPFNTFGISVKARQYLPIYELQDLRLIEQNQPIFVLGGGSNVLFSQDYEGLLVHVKLSGIEKLEETSEEVLLRVAAGENWHQLVLYTLANNWGGLENLALIPGTAGAAPIQNIGAYGAELSETFMYLDFYEFASRQVKRLTKAACQFGYRDSIFKNELKNKGIITAIYLNLKKQPHTLKLGYGAIKEALEKQGSTDKTTIQQVAKAVISIRQSKLPDPQKIGNCGSFFKNPEVPVQQYDTLKKQFPNLAAFSTSSPMSMKLAAGWLIEQCGWKGKKIGQAGVYEHQALVLVNHGNASAAELMALAKQIQHDVYQKFAVHIVPEVNVV
ncbi:MAG: UDP-N-acetylmuramate dehydrogenase [Cytophagales bacterium]|nr:MAG: UDP-N-acetylmuramate dehydrogenase [Cytophagales bacterium]TAF60129.1 MAG: UDP-N-acetylmuramate dehydrogenase [Cytophagales bacterium]